VRGALIAAGVALMAFALVSALTSADTKPYREGIFFIGALLLNDAVLAPVFAVVAVLVHRFVRRPYRAILQGGLLVTAAVTFLAFPFLLGFGRIPDNPSALPRNYLGGYAIILGVIWLAVTAAIVWRELARRPRHGSPTADSGGPASVTSES
jgi:hypothetical protein